MKIRTIQFITSALLMAASGCLPTPTMDPIKHEPSPKEMVRSSYDFLLMHPDGDEAMSNYLSHGKQPAPGFKVVCDGRGHYSPATMQGVTFPLSDWTLRTNEAEAVIASWRMKGIWDHADEIYFRSQIPKYDWHDCSAPEAPVTIIATNVVVITYRTNQ